MSTHGNILKRVVNIWKLISNIGINDYDRLRNTKSVILTNQVSFITTLICLVAFFNYWIHQLYFVGYIQIATVFFMVLPLVCNTLKRYTTAKILLFLTASLNTFMTSSALGYRSAEHYGYFPIIIGTFILFDKKERVLRWAFTLLSCLSLAVLESTDYSLFPIKDIPANVLKLLSLFNISVAVAIILICIKYFRNISDQHINDIIKNTYSELKGVFDNSHDAILLLDPYSFDITECNERASAIFRYESCEQIIGKNFFSLQKAGADTTQQNKVRESLHDNKAWVSDEMYLTEDGHEFWGNLAITKMVLEERTVLVARVTDITETKQVAILLENLTHDLKKVQSIIRLGYWHFEVATNHITYYSEEAAEQFSLQGQPHQISFDAFTKNMHPADLSRFMAAIEHSLEFQIPFDLELRVSGTQGIQWLHTKSELVVMGDGTVSNIICTSLDINRKKNS